MLDQLRQRAAQAVEMASSAGANDVFAYASRRRNVQFQHRDDILERVQESTSQRLTLCLYVDGRYSVHGTSDLNAERLSAFIQEATAMTRTLDEDTDRQIPDPALFANRSNEDLDLMDPQVAAFSAASRQEVVAAIAAAARGHEQVISATSAMSDSHNQSAAASSNGFEGSEESTSISLRAYTTLRDEGDSRPEAGYYVAATHMEDLPSPETIGQRAVARAAARLGAAQGQTQRTTMVVEPMAGRRLLGRFMSPANAEAISQQRSYFQGRIGQSVASSNLNIVDTPLLRRGLGSRHYDGEGISARTLPIIEAGSLSNLYVDTYYGRKTEMAPTTGSTSNVIIAPGQRSMDELISDVQQGVLITAWIGGNSDATTGEFSMGIRGHVIEGGQVGAPIGEMNVSGEMLELFGNLSAVGNDPWIYSSMRTPTMVFQDVQLSGA